MRIVCAFDAAKRVKGLRGLDIRARTFVPASLIRPAEAVVETLRLQSVVAAARQIARIPENREYRRPDAMKLIPSVTSLVNSKADNKQTDRINNDSIHWC
jgi:hypothetical protein